jgi:2-keto-3-deoxy-L-rhamnonate aldolase RhmA
MSNDKNQIKRVMDAAAHGIIVPIVKNIADAIGPVAATRYSQSGNIKDGLSPAQKFRQLSKKSSLMMLQLIFFIELL